MAAGQRAPYVVWLALAACVLALVAAGAPDAYRQHPAVCDAGQPGCDPMDADDRAELDDAGISPELLATYDGLSLPAFTIVAFGGLSALIVWRRPRDRFAVFCAGTLLLFGAVVQGGPTESLVAAHPVFELPVHVLELAGQVSFAALFYLFPDGRWVPRWTRWLLGRSRCCSPSKSSLTVPRSTCSRPGFLLFLPTLVVAGPPCTQGVGSDRPEQTNGCSSVRARRSHLLGVPRDRLADAISWSPCSV